MALLSEFHLSIHTPNCKKLWKCLPSKLQECVLLKKFQKTYILSFYSMKKSIGMSVEVSVNLLDMIVSTISGHYLDFFNIGIIAVVSVCSMNKFYLYTIWFCGRNMKYMSSFQPKRNVKRILATFPGSLQCRMSTNRPWPTSRSRPFGRCTRCSRSHWQQPAADAAYTSSPVSSSAPCDPFPEIAATTRVDDEHVLREFVNSKRN